MTLERYRGKIQLACDECGATTKQRDGDEFDILREDARDEGWSFWKDGAQWKHACPDCSDR